MHGKFGIIGISLWNALWPLFLYETLYGILYGGLGLLGGFTVAALAAGGYPVCKEWSPGGSCFLLVLSSAGAAGAAVPFLFACRKQNRKRRSIASGYFRFRNGLRIAALGAALCACGNILVWHLPIPREGFERISGVFHNPPAVLQLLCAGVIVPFAEEILFRGVIYSKMRENLPPLPCALFSALLFGVYHENAVQAVYAFALGLFLAWLMERFGSPAAPYLLHMTANMTSVLLGSTSAGILFGNTVGDTVIFVLGAAAAAAFIIKIGKERKQNGTETFVGHSSLL